MTFVLYMEKHYVPLTTYSMLFQKKVFSSSTALCPSRDAPGWCEILVTVGWAEVIHSLCHRWTQWCVRSKTSRAQGVLWIVMYVSSNKRMLKNLIASTYCALTFDAWEALCALPHANGQVLFCRRMKKGKKGGHRYAHIYVLWLVAAVEKYIEYKNAKLVQKKKQLLCVAKHAPPHQHKTLAPCMSADQPMLRQMLQRSHTPHDVHM